GAVRLFERGDADAPALLSRRRIAGHDVAGGGAQGSGEAVLAKDAEGFIGRVSLGNAAEIEPHVLLPQLDGPRLLIDEDVLISHTLESGLQGRGVGELLFSAGPPPQVDHRADGDVERSVARLRELEGFLK